jgi:hypothetical protein
MRLRPRIHLSLRKPHAAAAAAAAAAYSAAPRPARPRQVLASEFGWRRNGGGTTTTTSRSLLAHLPPRPLGFFRPTVDSEIKRIAAAANRERASGEPLPAINHYIS